MIGVYDEFAKLPHAAVYEAYAHPASAFEAQDALAEHARQIGASVGLTYIGRCSARRLMVGDIDRLERHKLYAVAPLGSEREATGMLAIALSKKHGAGSWWSTGPAVTYLWRYDGPGDDRDVRACQIDGVVHVLLAAYYFHDPLSAHWSAQLRAKVEASEAARKAREPSVVIEHDAEDLPWRTW